MVLRPSLVWISHPMFACIQIQYAKPLKQVSARIEEILDPLPYLSDATIDESDDKVQAGYAVRLLWVQAAGGKLDRE
jgi:hypothetical protein